MTIHDLEPKIVWQNFYGLTRIPRPSKHEGKVIEYLFEWGKSHGYETIKEGNGNIIIRAEATPGYENLKGVILQGHMDMVPQKNADKVHDFEKDPIETVVNGDWLKADGTTLGADNGLGVALALSVLESGAPHGPLEILITYDEETGMTGARALQPGVLKGNILINLDSETEGELYVGCAGGLDASAAASYEPQQYPESGYECYELAVKGFQGGHSGMDIILCRANANRIMARTLLPLLQEAGVKLIDLEGGSLRNAIPREAFATVYVPKDNIAKAQASIAKTEAAVRAEYAATDPDCQFIFRPCQGQPEDCNYVEDAAAVRFMQAILACPDGVERMSDAMQGLVETSNNLAIVKIEKGTFSVKTLMRSSVDSAKDYLAMRFAAVFALLGAEVSFTGGYSGWAPDNNSAIRRTMLDTYKKMFGTEPKIMAIHAGLECGILGGTYPEWDMISFGPTLLSPHSPDERAYIPSVQKVWDYLKEVLINIPEK